MKPPRFQHGATRGSGRPPSALAGAPAGRPPRAPCIAARKQLPTRLLWLFVPLLAAPTPGDTGGCGQAPQELDPPVFFASRDAMLCDSCVSCGFDTVRCREACAAPDRRGETFPARCVPLVHDGVVCLRALVHASCDEVARFVDDVSAEIPTECDFCPEGK